MYFKICIVVYIFIYWNCYFVYVYVCYVFDVRSDVEFVERGKNMILKGNKGFIFIEMFIVMFVIIVFLFIMILNVLKYNMVINNKGCLVFVKIVEVEV